MTQMLEIRSLDGCDVLGALERKDGQLIISGQTGDQMRVALQRWIDRGLEETIVGSDGIELRRTPSHAGDFLPRLFWYLFRSTPTCPELKGDDFNEHLVAVVEPFATASGEVDLDVSQGMLRLACRVRVQGSQGWEKELVRPRPRVVGVSSGANRNRQSDDDDADKPLLLAG